MAISYMQSIFPMYTKTDINHMAARKVLLDNVTFMTNAAAGGLGDAGPFPDHGNARSVYSYITGETKPQMPIGGKKWTAQQMQLYSQWMSDGFAP